MSPRTSHVPFAELVLISAPGSNISQWKLLGGRCNWHGARELYYQDMHESQTHETPWIVIVTNVRKLENPYIQRPKALSNAALDGLWTPD